MSELTGYADRRSVAPGEVIQFMISTDAPTYAATVTRLFHGDTSPNGPGFKERDVLQFDGERPGRHQPVHAGSYLVASGVAALPREGWTAAAWIHPVVTACAHRQAILARTASDRVAWALMLDEVGRPAFAFGSSVLRCEQPVTPGEWWRLAVTCDGRADAITLRIDACDDSQPGLRQLATVCRAGGARDVDGPLLVAARALVDADRPRRGALDVFNGKIEAPRLFDRPLCDHELDAAMTGEDEVGALHAGWRLGPDCGTQVPAIGPHGRPALPVNLPVRGVTSRHWDGSRHQPTDDAHQQYSALAFHDNALEDAGWEPDIRLTIPVAWPSGVYALRTRTEVGEDRVPFVVRPRRGRPTAPAALLLPTLTYLAYGNERMNDDGRFAAEKGITAFGPPDARDAVVASHPEWGVSLYDCHPGGVGCSLASWLRPIPNLRPDYRMWLQGGPRGLGADLYLVDWLQEKDFTHDVITDEDVHNEGEALLERYRVLLTGTHPEYWTDPMLRAMERYVRSGGRLMYLGGNGFYWVTSVDPDRPHVMEVRRGYAATRSWESRPGETYHGTTGEPGGLWKHRGRPPQRLVGVGFTAQGWDERGAGYVRTAASEDPRVSFIFEGVPSDEVIGDFGLVMGGAVGDEVDRADPAQGTPSHTLVLATSQPLSARYLAAVEQIPATHPSIDGETNPELVHADMTYMERPGGGAVFSVGSINWASALSHHHYDNPVSRITENVLRRFLMTTPA